MRGFAVAGAVGLLALSGAAQAQDVDIGAPPPPAEDALKPSAETPQSDTQRSPANAAGPERTKGRRYVHQRDLLPSALAGDTQSTPPPGLIGDWQKIRTTLGERGIGVSARYASESGYNFAGGRRKLLTETGQFDAGVLLDLEKVMGLTGGAIQGTITWRRGVDLTTTAGLGALQQVQEVYGRGQTVRVTQLWYEQRIGEHVEVKIGRTNPGEDFAVFSCHFQNLSFCGAQPGNLVGDYWYNWPVSQWGGRVHVDVLDDLYVQAGVYEINPRNLENDFFIGHFKGATGALIPVEAGWSRGGDQGHVGSVKVGGWIGTADANDVFFDSNRQAAVVTGTDPLRRSSRYGVYLTVQQQLTGTSKDGKALTGLGFFANVTQADRQTSVTDNQVSLGLFYKGLVPQVPGDVIGIGVARTNVNGRAAAGDALVPGTPVRDAEYAAELYYSVHPAEWLEVRPNLQWIHHPGGIRSADDVGVVGLKAALTL